MSNLKKYLWSLPVLGFVCYLFAGKLSITTTISNTLFLMGMICLIVGGILLIRRSGLFFFTKYGIKRFFSILFNKKVSSSSAGEDYETYIKAVSENKTYLSLFIIAFAFLAISMVFALL
ncbi:MAG: DUF3899 domain-containing protein [Bacillota bacterium]|nr:DUF3899 domain-containing protein [Bacillota bacterium]